MNMVWLLLAFGLLSACSQAEGLNGQGQPAPPPAPVAQKSQIELDRIGQRLTQCQQPSDWQKYNLSSSQAAQMLPQLESGAKAVLKFFGQNCFRVGSEFSFETQGRRPLLAKAVPTKIVYDKRRDESQIHYDVLESFKSVTITSNGERVPNCPDRYFDWDKFLVDKDKAKQMIPRLRDGSISASIWNGAFNCFRVGKTVEINVRGEKGSHGELKVSEVRVLHVSELSEDLARQTGLSLTELKAELSKEPDKDGGYLSFVAFEPT